MNKVLDVIGVGFGPANIAVAIANEELDTGLSMRFLERAPTSQWQPGMQFGQSDIQNHPLRDLATPRNPRSQYSFTNFLFSKGRLFEFLNLGRTYPLRTEYSQYVEWVAGHFSHQVQYGTSVQSVSYVAADRSNDGKAHYEVSTSDGEVHCGRSLLLAPGRTPFIPPVFANKLTPRVVHLNHYIPTLKALQESGAAPKRVAVVGGSQSAAEILVHLADELPDAEVVGFNRSFGFRLKDTSPFTGEVYFPEFVDLFYSLDKDKKKRLAENLHYTNYSATDSDVLDALYLKMYQQKVENRERLSIRRSADILGVDTDEGGATLRYTQIEHPDERAEHFDLVVLATGFRNLGTGAQDERHPAIFAPLAPYAEKGEGGVIQVNSDYTVKMHHTIQSDNPCYMNGLCESTHGMGDAGSFSLLSLRSKVIVESLERRLNALPSSAKVTMSLRKEREESDLALAA